MGTRDGIIMAAIITTHIPMNVAAAPTQVCPDILIHAIDMVQPPGIAMLPDIDRHQWTVAAALAMKRIALVPRNPRSRGQRAPCKAMTKSTTIGSLAKRTLLRISCTDYCP
jgi:hypothetical protein